MTHGSRTNFANVNKTLVNPVIFVFEVEILGVKLVLLGDHFDLLIVVGGAPVRGNNCLLEVRVVEVGA